MKTLKITYLYLLLTIIFYTIFTPCITAQNNQTQNTAYVFWNTEMQAIARPESKPGRVYFKDSLNTPIQDIFTTHADAFGLGVGDEIYEVSNKTDNYGNTHIKYMRKLNGKVVLNDFCILHIDVLGKIKLQYHFSLHPVQTTLNMNQYNVALNNLMNDYDSIYVENEILFPVGGNLEYSGAVNCFKDDINTINKIISKTDGQILESRVLSMDCDIITSCTKQVGQQKVKLNQVGSQYYFENDCDVVPYKIWEEDLQTINYTSFTVESATVNPTDCSHDNASLVNLSYSLERSVTFFQQQDNTFNGFIVYQPSWAPQNGFYPVNYYEDDYTSIRQNLSTNGNSFPTTTRIRLLNSTQFSNAGIQLFEFEQAKSRFDIVGHEFTHGMIANLGSNLKYARESGALNDSFADIFGTLVEMESLGNGNIDWLYADGAYYGAYPYSRNLSNPKDPLSKIQQPDTYQGSYWAPTNCPTPIDAYDFCGVHTNSGVQNFWFYLLVEGGTGVNDHGNPYSVQPIGVDKAAMVTYQNMMNYLSFDAGFHDARQGSIDAATDLYTAGVFDLCDIESIKSAWDAVGVYNTGSALETAITSNTTWNGVDLSFEGTIRVSNSANLTISNYSTINMKPGTKIILEDNTGLNINSSGINVGSGAGGCGNASGWNGIEIIGDNVSLTISTSTINNAVNALYLDDISNLDATITNAVFSNNATAVNNNLQDTSNHVEIYNCIFENTDLSSSNNNFQEYRITPQPVQAVPHFLPAALASAGISPNSLFGTSLGISYVNVDITKNKNIGINGLDNISVNTSWFNNLDSAIISDFNNNTGIGNAEINTNYFNKCNSGIAYQDYWSAYGNNLTIVNNRFNNNVVSIKPKKITNLTIQDNTIRNMPISDFEYYTSVEIAGVENLIYNNNSIYGTAIGSNHYGAEALVIQEAVDNISVSNSSFFGVGTGIRGAYGGQNTFLIENCLFNSTAIGIYSNSAMMSINENIFEHTKKGIYIYDKCHITNNQFINIPAAVDDGLSYTIDDTYGIFLSGGGLHDNMEISDNEFSGSATSGSVSPTSLHSHGIIVENVNNSTAKVSIFQNTFQGVDIGVQAQGDNSALIVKCNEFALQGNTHAVAGLYVFDNVNDMGDACDDGNPNTIDNQLQAGNEWFDLCPDGSTAKTDILVDNAASNFTYWAHGSSVTNGETTVPYCSSTNKYTLRKCTEPTGPNVERQKDANSCTTAFAGWQRPAPNENTDLDELIAEYISDRDVYILQLNNLQMQLTNPELQNTLVKEIKDTYTNIDDYNVKIAELFKEKNDEPGYENFMESTESAATKLELAEHYMDEEDFTAAQQSLQEVILYSRPSYLYKDINAALMANLNKEYAANIKQLEIELAETERTKLQLGEEEIIMLQEIEAAHVPVSTIAEQWLSLYSYEAHHHPIKKGSMNTGSNNEDAFDYQLSILPNPSSVTATVLFSMPPNAEEVQIIVFDQYHQMGNLMEIIEADELTNSATINTSSLNTGVYLVYLQVDGVGVAGEQLIVIH